MGKFFNGKIKRSKEQNIKYIIIGSGALIIIIIFILIISVNSNRNKANIELYEEVNVEINSELPEASEYFANSKNYDINKATIDTSNVDLTQLGTYIVYIDAGNNGNAEVKLNVIDTTAPSLNLKNVKIGSGESYEIEDFIENCEDNSNESCNYKYYDLDIDDNNNSIDYSNYTEDGVYQIKIVAYDSSENESEVKITKLYIGNVNEDGSEVCEYGDLTIPDYVTYPVAVTVGDTVKGCALNRDLWDNETTQTAVTKLFNEDKANLQKDWDKIKNTKYPNGANIVVEPHYIAVWNSTNKGLIGYAIYVKVFVADQSVTGSIDTDNYLKLAYYIKSDKTRQYEKNEFGF